MKNSKQISENANLLNKKTLKEKLEKIAISFQNYANYFFLNIKLKMFPKKTTSPANETVPSKKISTKTDYKKEIIRKTFHTLTILILPIAYIFLTKKIMLTVIFPLAILVIAIDHFRHTNPLINKIFRAIFGRILRESELENFSKTGASYTLIAAAIIFAICPKIIAICAFLILAISDTLAALVGKKLISNNFFEKSVAGSSAFGISALLILISCGVLTNQEFGFYLFGVFAVFATTIIEARPNLLSIDDNFTIPVSFATIMVFFGFVWGISY